MIKDKMNEILENHAMWLSGAGDECADLRGADLRRADLYEADLRRADLREADLYEADLRRADFRGADLRRADLRGADLYEADLYEADLRGADLRRADLYEADLRRADLREADLRGAKHVPYVPMTCPDAGAFVGWKKASRGLIVKLLITEDSKRSSGTSRECRCDKAVVLAIEYPNGGDSGIMEVASEFDREFVYHVNETITVQDYDDDRWNECSAGIHFFINRQEAVNYTG